MEQHSGHLNSDGVCPSCGTETKPARCALRVPFGTCSARHSGPAAAAPPLYSLTGLELIPGNARGATWPGSERDGSPVVQVDGTPYGCHRVDEWGVVMRPGAAARGRPLSRHGVHHCDARFVHQWRAEWRAE